MSANKQSYGNYSIVPVVTVCSNIHSMTRRLEGCPVGLSGIGPAPKPTNWALSQNGPSTGPYRRRCCVVGLVVEGCTIPCVKPSLFTAHDLHLGGADLLCVGCVLVKAVLKACVLIELPACRRRLVSLHVAAVAASSYSTHAARIQLTFNYASAQDAFVQSTKHASLLDVLQSMQGFLHAPQCCEPVHQSISDKSNTSSIRREQH